MANTELSFKDKAAPKAEDKQGDKSRSLIGRLKKVKNIEIYVAVFAVAVMLLIYFTSKGVTPNNANTGTAESYTSDYCVKMERQLETALSSLKDAGRTIVVVNWESGVEAVIAYISNNGSTASTQTPQIIQSNGSSKPIVLKEIYPKALGVIVVCEGGDRPSVRIDIINAVSGLLAVPADRVRVFAMSKPK